jgi:anti-sigma B factor antagonist
VTSFSSVVVESPGGARVILRGELDAASVRAADSTLRELLDRGPDQVTLDLTELDFMDSMGVKFLIDGRDAAAERGVDLALAYEEGVVERVLTVSGVATLFTRQGAADDQDGSAEAEAKKKK